MSLAEADLIKQVDHKRLPRHVAIIMDGNGRWAARKMRPRIFGHRAGVETVDRIITLAAELKIKAITLYSFSTENWSRPPREVNALMGILQKYLLKEMMKMMDNNIKFNTIGHLDDLPQSAVDCIEKVKQQTKDNTGTILTLALSYGSRNEIVEATRLIAEKVQKGELSKDEITPELFNSFLQTADLPDVDLLIRTSGEVRISNFMMWQIAYSELYFTDVLWPDFSKSDFLQAIVSYQERERRFGRSSEQLKQEDDSEGEGTSSQTNQAGHAV